MPIVADIHSSPRLRWGREWVEKVRINPGNYADSKKFKILEYTDEHTPRSWSGSGALLTAGQVVQRAWGAMRIGTNHGSSRTGS